MNSTPEIQSELMVIGSGLTGMAAALFAANRNISTTLVGRPAEINFASGLLDLMAVHPVKRSQVWRDPWAAIAAMCRDNPNHPYARLNPDDISLAIEEFTCFLAGEGLRYRWRARQNVEVITPIGTTKPTYCVPDTMWNGVEALEGRRRGLLIDFHGLKGFSARQIAESLRHRIPGLRTIRITFPDSRAEVYPEAVARSLENPSTLKRLSREIQPHTGKARWVGLPAILGIHRSADVCGRLEAMLGLPVTEIPTMPPAITGIRLREAFEQGLPQLGVQTFLQHQIVETPETDGSGFRFLIGGDDNVTPVATRGAVLATGRFFGRGLRADRSMIHETVFDLPVCQPETRRQWHRKDFFDPRGHNISRAGLETDDRFRPVNQDGRPIYPTLHAAGSILAHQDWIRMKCGAGLAIATAFGAVNAYLKANPRS